LSTGVQQVWRSRKTQARADSPKWRIRGRTEPAKSEGLGRAGLPDLEKPVRGW